MASNSMDFLLNLRANPRGLDEISSSTSQMVQGFHDATRALSQVGDASQLNTENLQQMAAAGQQAVIQLNAELRVAQLELNRLAATNASPADLDAARDRVQALEQSVQQTTTAVEAYQDAARAASQTPPVPSQFQNEVSSLVTELDDARRSIDATGNSSTHTRQQLEQMAANATNEIQRYERELNDARQEVNRLAATNATPEDIERARQRVRELETGIEQTRTALNGFRNAANISTDGLERGLERTEKKTNIARFAMTALATALASLGVGAVAQNLAKTSDSFVNLATRINIATKEGGNFEQAMAGVQQIALATNSNLTTTADLFTRLNTVGKDMGMTQKQALDLTKTVTQAIQIGGGSAEAADAAVTQFIQAMQGGVLRGEEFNSIMEGGYGLAEALAKGLGVTTGELRKMAEAGELSAERVIKAVSSQAESVQKTYDQFPTTIGNALQRVATSWEILIGQMNEANGANATVSKWLVTLADNMSLLKPIIDDIGSGFSRFGEYFDNLYDKGTIDALKTALTSVYETIKTLLSEALEVEEALHDVFNDALSAVFGFTEGLYPAGQQVSGFQKFVDLLNIAINFLNDGFKTIGIGVNLFTGTLYGLSAAWYELKAVFTWGDVKKEALENMQQMQAKSQEYFDKGFSGAENFKSKTLEAINEIGKTEAQKNQDRIASNQKALDDLKAQEAKHATDYKAISDQRLTLEQQLFESRKTGNQASIDLAVKGLADLDAKEKLYQAESKKIQDAKIKAAQDWVNAQLMAADGTQKAADAATQKTLQTAVAAQGLKIEFDAAGKGIVSAMSDSTQAVNPLAKELDQARIAGKALGLDLDVVLNKVSEGFKTGDKNLETFTSKLGQMGATGQQAADITYQAWIKWLETAKSQAEIDAAEQKLKEFGEQGKISTSQVEQGLIAIKMQAQKLPDDIDPVTESFKRLGIETKENLKLAAKQAMMDFINVRDSGQATAEGVQKAYEKAAQAAALSGDAASIATANAAGASHKLQIQVDETGKASVQSMDNLTSSVERLARTAGGSAVQGFRAMGDAAKDAAREAKNSIDEWNDALTAKSDAQKAERDKSSSSKAVGSSFKSYSRAEVLAELKSMGYDDAQAKKLAGSIMSSAFDADKATMSKNIDPFINDQFNKLLGQGLTASAGSAEVQKRLASLANGTGLVTMANPKSTRRLEVSNGQQTATLDGSDQDVDTLESIMSEFEMLKKST
ncbi:tape measure protein [Acinetobacter sichuanensis]|uniref:tape measure protein n=1 Tax=Acinetobacter sichuanensis TaxID=2136183 RepID=UPI00280F8D10|nr:tape measure protein [Acinetobacter sichuanensis]MDQ9021697.1 tape measure protein [Acinetobacter sichuanensis]